MSGENARLAQTSHDLIPGFADPVHDAQKTFRAILDAMAHPGRIVDLPVKLQAPKPLRCAATAVALTLFDHDTPVWLDTTVAESGRAMDFLRFHCGCPFVDGPGKGRFALIGDTTTLPHLGRFDAGSDAWPDESATLVIEVSSLDGGPAVTLTGPGIECETNFAPFGLPDWFWGAWAVNHAAYPLGLDVILTCGKTLAALPRSTAARIAGAPAGKA
jgi:alpha-D-ribose 1-methylphosphonate 5-triphosphate synthase subunit PhnH